MFVGGEILLTFTKFEVEEVGKGVVLVKHVNKDGCDDDGKKFDEIDVKLDDSVVDDSKSVAVDSVADSESVDE